MKRKNSSSSSSSWTLSSSEKKIFVNECNKYKEKRQSKIWIHFYFKKICTLEDYDEFLFYLYGRIQKAKTQTIDVEWDSNMMTMNSKFIREKFPQKQKISFLPILSKVYTEMLQEQGHIAKEQLKDFLKSQQKELN
ncbi:unnamed protein product [Paramecium sonneborni]|uniref:Uncharacterized protein n=1 Tax=Paramecium sonneborni TaxID=65129 RepID=A0A8S1PN27_9CILI|nr:unnamed protein product [Paramecium sonneborni]